MNRRTANERRGLLKNNIKEKKIVLKFVGTFPKPQKLSPITIKNVISPHFNLLPLQVASSLLILRSNYCSESIFKTTDIDIIVKGLILGLSKFFFKINFFPINFISEKKTGKIWWEISKPQNCSS